LSAAIGLAANRFVDFSDQLEEFNFNEMNIGVTLPPLAQKIEQLICNFHSGTVL